MFELVGGQKSDKAFRSALGSFIGFLVGTLMKLIVSCAMLYYFIVEIIHSM